MKRFPGLLRRLAATAWLSAGMLAGAAEMPLATVAAPGGGIRARLAVRDGHCVYSADFRGIPAIEPSLVELAVDPPFEGGFESTGVERTAVDTVWRPVWGDRAEIPERYEGAVAHLRERGPAARLVNVELRAYPEGVALRCVIPAQAGARTWTVRQEAVEFRFVPGSAAFPIHSGEQTFSRAPVPLADLKPGAHTPLTVALPDGFASVTEACVVDYPRLVIGTTADGAPVTNLRGPASVPPPFATPWRVILLGADEGELVANAHLVPTLNPPCAIADTSWLAPGRTISNEGGAPLQTEALKGLVDFGATNGFRHLQLDWGWYGTETAWTDTEVERFRPFVPERFRATAWEANTRADPFHVASGYVPYRPDEKWKGLFATVDLDVPALVRHARGHGMGVCLYLEAGHTLFAQDLDRLFATYESWGIAGLKPGFVRTGRQEDTAWIRRMVETAARHRLWLCIHDAHVPDGMERTWPNLMISEGGGGQEGHHPVVQDVMLPFTRCLAGPFDYTPMLYTRGRSHAHMLGMMIAYLMPTPIVRGGFRPWRGETGGGAGGAELAVLRRLPTTWDETRVLEARIGRRLLVARRRGASWFLGGLTGPEAFETGLSLDFLEPGRAYVATVAGDDARAARDGWCPATVGTRRVTGRDRLTVRMEPAGGVVAVFDPEDGRTTGDAR